MRHYTENDLLRLAKRYNNPKRTYLLVDPLQAKHLPVSPSASSDMMDSLGACLHEKYPGTKLVIGFAETATAIGAGVASAFADCTYIHTTRECMQSVREWVFFSEEHSHAVEQKLCADRLGELLARTDTVIFVDDELSTGKTLLNIVEKLRRRFPEAEGKPVVIATVINRVSPENIELLAEAGIICEQLLKLENLDYSAEVEDYVTAAPALPPPVTEPSPRVEHLRVRIPLLDPRMGVSGAGYRAACRSTAEDILAQVAETSLAGKRVLVLGTEECMYPAIRLGVCIEERFPSSRVRSHSTTRSPIATRAAEGYPIRNGYRIHSFYGEDRETFLYNIDSYDTVILLTDAKRIPQTAEDDLIRLLAERCSEMYFVGG